MILSRQARPYAKLATTIYVHRYFTKQANIANIYSIPSILGKIAERNYRQLKAHIIFMAS